MPKRTRKAVLTLAAVSALAGGGAVYAQAQGTAPKAPVAAESTTAPDTDTVQSGDQTGPDQQNGSDPTDTTGGNEQSGEQSGESAPGNDGPGGHADEPGNPNADHQFQGNE
jgi:hypothetical protein